MHNDRLDKMVLKGQYVYTIMKLGLMVLTGYSIGYTIQKSSYTVLKGVNWVHNEKIR